MRHTPHAAWFSMKQEQRREQLFKQQEDTRVYLSQPAPAWKQPGARILPVINQEKEAE